MKGNELHKNWEYVVGNLADPKEDLKGELSVWLEDVSNRKIFNEIVKYREALDVYEDNNIERDIDRKRLLSVIDTPRIKSYRWLYYAASVAAIFILAYTTWYISGTLPDFNKKLEVAEMITPGSSKAELILSDGRIVDLEADSVMHMVQKGKDNIAKLSDKHLEYKKANKNDVNNSINVLRVPRGGEYKLVLADGTKVWLNSDSQLEYPVSFSGKTREVKLKGEAYFEVAHNAEKPFKTNVNGAIVKVLGTSFNVSAYEEDNKFVTTLVTGKVKIDVDGNGKNKTAILEPGQQLIYDESIRSLDVRKVNTNEYTAWKEGRLYIKEMTLEAIMVKLERWYDFTTFYQNEEVKDYRFEGVVDKYMGIKEVLDILSETTKVGFRIKGKTVIAYKKE